MKYKTILNLPIFSYSFLFVAISLIFVGANSAVYAQEIPADKKEVFSSTGLPIPRFVSLSKEVTNVRAGPGQQYPVRWVYNKRGLPVEVILEYDHWRKIRDREGSEGWVYKTLLSGKRTAFVIGAELVHAYDDNPSKNSKKSKVIMMVEPSTLVSVSTCVEAACLVEVSDLSGWIERKSLWGVYEAEKFD